MTDRLLPRVGHLPAEVVPRVLTTVAARDCDGLPKVEGAGEVRQVDGTAVQVMHNGVLVEAGGYFGDWMAEIIRCLRGHHEPQEELVFARVLERLGPAPVVVELGAFWAYYALWALHERPQARVVALEPDPANLALGRRNAALNGREITFVHGVMGREPGTVETFGNLDGSTVEVRQYGLADLMVETGLDRIDLLLCDIQGGEQFVLGQAADLLRSGRVRFAVVSTHHHSISGDPLTHQKVLAELVALGAHVVAEHTVGESASGDGLVAVSFDPADRDLMVRTSRTRQGDALFGPPEAELAAALDDVAHRTAERDAATTERDALHGRLADVDRQRAVAQARADALEGSRLMRATEPLRATYARLRAAAGRGAVGTAFPAEAPVDPPAPDPLAVVRAHTPLAATAGAPQLLFATDDEVIGRELLVGGGFDVAPMRRALQVVRALDRPGGVFVDVGANIGTTTVTALTELGFARAVCFEPDATNVRLLRANLALNDLQDHAVVHHAGVSERAGELLLELADGNRGDHRLRIGPAVGGVYGEADRVTLPVPVVGLDEALAREGLHPDDLGVVWVDTQGHEAHVLAGALATLRAGVPFVLELWPYGLRRAGGLDRLLALVAEHAGSFVDVGVAGSVPRPASALGEVVAGLTGTAHTDVVLLPR